MAKITGPDGKEHETTPVEVSESTERWSDYTLEDGTKVKIKPVLISIDRVVGEFDALGNPVYVVSAQPVMAVVATDDSLKRKP